MPKLTNTIEIEITPERYLKACSDMELFELDMLICSERYQSRIRALNSELQAENADAASGTLCELCERKVNAGDSCDHEKNALCSVYLLSCTPKRLPSPPTN